ncbi:MAG: glycosyltransferase [Verrucomicrobia bacterium]|nr:glycosyltransferase [Verrucomicrobiota bacterium]
MNRDEVRTIPSDLSRESHGPLVSIITVCRNEAGPIQRTITSVLEQTSPSFEWIVVDGASTDGTLALLQSHASSIAKLVSEPDSGIYDAMNKGAHLATGRWLLFLNGGDALATRTVMEEMAPLLEANSADIWVGAHWHCGADGVAPRLKKSAGRPDVDHFYRRTVNHQSAFISREAFAKYGPYDQSFRILADYDFFVRAVLGGARVQACGVLVARYDATGLSAQKKNSPEMRREQRRIRSHFPLAYRARRWANDLYVSVVRKSLRSARACEAGGRPKLALVNVWFGALPFWTPALFRTCGHNPEVDWLIVTDQPRPSYAPENVRFIPMTLERYNARASEVLGYRVNVQPTFLYKLCDLKVMIGRILEAELRGYDFWGSCDLDVLWGNVRGFVTDELLAEHDVITSRPNRISGHFALFRNRPEWSDLFRRIPDVQRRIEDSLTYRRVDEDGLSAVLQWYRHRVLGRWVTRWIRRLPLPRVWWERVWTTSGKHQRLMLEDESLQMKWVEGRAYGVDGQEMMYLHFHSIRKQMQGTDVGASDRPRAISVSPAGIYMSKLERVSPVSGGGARREAFEETR